MESLGTEMEHFDSTGMKLDQKKGKLLRLKQLFQEFRGETEL
jgi:hypothetical protein